MDMPNQEDGKGYNLGDYAERWYQRMWRPMMAGIYMFLCVLDYGVRPMINYAFSKQFNLAETVFIIKDLEPTVQVRILDNSKQVLMDPILTEFVHLAFGAILGIAAFSRGSEKGFTTGSQPSPPKSPNNSTPAPVNNRPTRPRPIEVDNPDG